MRVHLTLVFVLAVVTRASASNPYLVLPPESEVVNSPAYRYSNLDDAAALAEVAHRGLPFARESAAVPGVRSPGRLTGPLSGIRIHGTVPAPQAATTPFEILDARLALALDDFSRLLAAHGIVELVHFTIHRPSVAVSTEGATRHAGALAIDVGALRKADGTWLTVGKDWSPSLGAKTCGPDGRRLENPAGRELMSILCEAADLHLFTYALTPHFDRAHSDHLHLEIKPKVRWFLYN